MTIKIKKFCTIFLLLFFLLNCETVRRVQEDVFTPERGAGQLTLYFKPIARGNFHIYFQLDSIETENFDGHRIIISSKVYQVSSREWLDQQVKLAEVMLPPNRYKGIYLKISKAMLERDGEKVTMIIPEGPIQISLPFQIFSNENTPIFINWDVDRSVESEIFFKPVMNFLSKGPQLKSLMIYVTQERSNNVVVINRDTDQIISMIEVGKEPHGIAILNSLNRVYVTNSGEDTISVIDTQTNRVLNKVNTRLGSQPEGIAASSDGRIVVVCFFGTNQVSIRDANSMRELIALTVDKGPLRVVIDPRSRKAFVSNYYSNTVTVIDTSLLRIIGVIPVESNPIGLTFNSRGDRLYVVNSSSSNISVIDPSGQTVIGKINVGTGGYGILSDLFGDRLFLTRSTVNQLLFINAPVNTITKILPMDRKPSNMGIDPDGKKIYVINRDSNSISVVNKILGTVEKRIGVGENPYDIAIAQQ